MSHPLTESSLAFAGRLGVSKGLVSQYASEGMPSVRNDKGKVSGIVVGAALRWIAANKPNSNAAPLVPDLLASIGEGDQPAAAPKDQPASRKPAASAREPGEQADPLIDRGDQGPDVAIDASSLTEAKRLHEILKAERTKLALETDLGGRVLKSAVEGVIYKHSRRVRGALLGFEDRHGPSMCAELGIDAAVGCPIIGKFMRIVAVELAEGRAGAEDGDDA